MTIKIHNTDGPVAAVDQEIGPAKVEKWYRIAHSGTYIGNQRENMRNADLIATVRVNTTAFKATGSFNNPEMFTQAAPIQADTDLPGPENKESIQVIDRTTGIAIVPAINQADNLCAPI